MKTLIGAIALILAGIQMVKMQTASALTIECKELQLLSGVSSVKWTSVGHTGKFKMSQSIGGQPNEKVVDGIETAILEPTSSLAENTIVINPAKLDRALHSGASQVEGFYSHVNLVTGTQEVGFWIPCDVIR